MAMSTLGAAIIFVKDLPRMTAFYRDGIGLELVASPEDGWASFDAGGVSLVLHAIPSHIAERIQIGNPPEARESTPLKLVFRTADVTAARAHLQAHGAVMFDARSGRCDGLDPEGNVFQIVSAG